MEELTYWIGVALGGVPRRDGSGAVTGDQVLWLIPVDASDNMAGQESGARARAAARRPAAGRRAGRAAA